MRGATGPVALSPKAFDLLVHLVEQRPRALSKDELHEWLWPGVYVSETNLAGLIAEIRRALGDDARSPRFVRTVQRFGYAFSGNVGNAVPRIPGPRIARTAGSPAGSGTSHCSRGRTFSGANSIPLDATPRRCHAVTHESSSKERQPPWRTWAARTARFCEGAGWRRRHGSSMATRSNWVRCPWFSERLSRTSRRLGLRGVARNVSARADARRDARWTEFARLDVVDRGETVRNRYSIGVSDTSNRLPAADLSPSSASPLQADIDSRSGAAAHVRDHLPPGRGQDDADGEAPAVCGRHRAGRCGPRTRRQARGDIGLDGDRAASAAFRSRRRRSNSSCRGAACR